MSIFVQLVSYKNFDTVPTVADCLSKASDKSSIRFGIVLQQDEPVPQELNAPNISVQKFPLAESRGHGWARSIAQSMYSSEDYILQVESGTRFAEGWDTTLIEALKSTGKDKPMISNCANKFNPDNGDLEVKDVAYRSQPHMFLGNVPSCWASPMKGTKQIVPARVVVDHFIFTVGSHSKECPYDPLLYWGELDSAVSIRSFTHGYDMFNHFVPVVWRNYNRRPQHWDDHRDWWVRSNESANRFAELVAGRVRTHGLGGTRSLNEYQRYSGLDFSGRRIHKDVIAGKNPPTEYSNEESWDKSMAKDHSLTVSWNTDEIERCDDYDYWYFAIEDAAGNNIVRQDIRQDRDAPTIQFKTNYRKVFFKSFEGRAPATLCIWPVSKSKGWLKKSKFPIGGAV
jgi:hypothetical protein